MWRWYMHVVFLNKHTSECYRGRCVSWLRVYLSHLFDFGASLSNEGATLTGWDDKPQSYRRFAGGWTVAHGVDYILRGEIIWRQESQTGV